MKLLNPHIYIGFFITLLSAAAAVAYSQGGLMTALLSLFVWVPVLGLSLFTGAVQAQKDDMPADSLVNIVAVFAVFALGYGYYENGLEYGLLLFILWIQVAKNVVLIKERDLYLGLIISMTALIFAAANTMKGGFATFIVIYAFGCVYSLMALYQNNRVGRAGIANLKGQFSLGLSVPWFASLTLVVALALYFTVPRPAATHFGAFPAQGGEDFSSDKWEQAAQNKDGKADQQFESGADEASGKDESDALGRDSDQSEKLEEFSDSYGVGMQGSGALSNELLFYVQAPHGLYLRGKTHDSFDSRGWFQSDRGFQTLTLENGGLEVKNSDDSDAVQLTVHMQVEHTSNLLSPGEVTALNFPGTVVGRDAYGSYSVPKAIADGTSYSVRAKLPQYQGRPVGSVQQQDQINRYLQLPVDFPDSIAQYAKQQTNNIDNAFDKAVALEQHLRNDFEYTFDSVFDKQNVGNLETFIFDTKKGHCSYFATALATMLRSLDIPSRVVTGFSATTYNPLSGYYEVRGLDAHAWVEVLQPDVGWVTFEPTAYYNLPLNDSDSSVSQSMESYLAELNRQSELNAETADLSLKQYVTAIIYQTFKRIRTLVGVIKEALVNGVVNHFGKIILLIAVVFGLMQLRIVLALPLFKLVVLIKSLFIKNKSLVRQHEFYFESMSSVFALVEYARNHDETITEYRNRLVDIFPELNDAILDICNGQNAALFMSDAGNLSKLAMRSSEALRRLMRYRHKRPKKDIRAFFLSALPNR